jgi:glycerophosphoryl diester phosphodiesterase
MQHGATAAAVQRGGDTPPLIVAHRGAWDAAPQNSLESVERAIGLGCDAIEIDVRRTADGRIALVHDARIRLRPVRRLEHHQVQARMKAGQAPLLEEVIQFAAGRIVVDIELKEDGYVGDTMAAVTRHMTCDQYVITSFREPALAKVRRHVPDARTGLLLAPRRPRDVARRLQQARADFIAPHVSLARNALLGWADSQGVSVWVWTVNETRALRALCQDHRVTAVITDKPGDALRLLHAVDTADSRE